MLNKLKEGIVWVEMIYSDNTRKLFRSTLNVEILKELTQSDLLNLEDGLYDIDKKKMVALEGSIKVHENKVELNEIDAFIGRFI